MITLPTLFRSHRMAKFHEISVKDVVQETPTSISVGLDIPESLREEFQYIQGQYITLKVEVNGEELRRSYSICSSPIEDGVFRIAVKKVDGGRVSTFLQSIQPGHNLEVMPPMGNFYTMLDASNAKQYVAFAAGSGITPVISILKTVLHKEPRSKFILFYGNKSKLETIFRNELDHIHGKYPDRFLLYNIYTQENTGDPLLEGRMTTDKISTLVDEYVEPTIATEYFLCGPEEVIANASDVLKSKGIDKGNVHIELFTSPVEGAIKTDEPKPSGDSVSSHVTVIMDDEETEFELSSGGEVILDAALDAGVDVPFSCKGAVCCTCKAKVIEGSASMDMNYALSDGEVEDGFILTCQAHPTSEKLVVDYDVL